MKKFFNSNIMSQITITSLLDEAFIYVYSSRLDNHANSDLCRLSLSWNAEKQKLRDLILARKFQLSALSLYSNHEGLVLA